jgi:hypothetical protein
VVALLCVRSRVWKSSKPAGCEPHLVRQLTDMWLHRCRGQQGCAITARHSTNAISPGTASIVCTI